MSAEPSTGPLNLIQTPMVFTNVETAEVTKYAGNALSRPRSRLSTRSPTSARGRCRRPRCCARHWPGRPYRPEISAPWSRLRRLLLPKDTLALAPGPCCRKTADDRGAGDQRQQCSQAADGAEGHRFRGGSISGLTIGVLGLTFNQIQTTCAMPSLTGHRAGSALAAGAKIVAFDPEGMREAAHMLSGVVFAETAYEVASEADLLVVITEWQEFRGLDPRRLKSRCAIPESSICATSSTAMKLRSTKLCV